jgi:hypothetical protein
MTPTQIMRGMTDLPEALHTRSGSALRTTMRKLWTDHIVWTHYYIYTACQKVPVSERLTTVAGKKVVASIATKPVIGATVSHLGEADAVAVRLLKNQEDIGDAIEPYYGKVAAKKLTNLLRAHIMIAVELVAAARENDTKKFAREDKRWDENAEDIARFLSKANEFWPEDQVLDLLTLHLELTKKDTTLRLKEDWAKEARVYEDIFNEILTLADTLSAGIVQQFPSKFET